MQPWILNTPLLFEDSSNVLFLESILHYKTLKIIYFFRGALSSLRQFLATEAPLKMMKMLFISPQ